MSPDRTKCIADRGARGRRSAAALAVRFARSARTGALALLLEAVTPLAGVTAASISGWLARTLFPVRDSTHELPGAARSSDGRVLTRALRRALAGVAVVMAGVFFATGLAAGTYAYLNAQVTTPAITVKSGNLAVTVQYGSGVAGAATTLPTAPWGSMLPGDVVAQQFTVANTGTAGANFNVRLSVVTAWDIRLAAGTCPATPLTTTPLTMTAVAAGSLSGGSSSAVCLQATLPSTSAASVSGTMPTFSVLIDATQVPS